MGFGQRCPSGRQERRAGRQHFRVLGKGSVWAQLQLKHSQGCSSGVWDEVSPGGA